MSSIRAYAGPLGTPTSAEPEAKPPSSQESAKQQPAEAEREGWRKKMLRIPRPKNGCFTATYPETEWREVPCKEPPHKPYPPKRLGMMRTDTVGGTGSNFSAVVTGHITEAEGSFDRVTGVTSECAVQCPERELPYEIQLALQMRTNTLYNLTQSPSRPRRAAPLQIRGHARGGSSSYIALPEMALFSTGC